MGTRMAGLTGIITGGAGPLGARLTTAFAAQGARVIVLDLPDAMESVRSVDTKETVCGIPCDLTRTSDLDAALRQSLDFAGVEGVDFLVNNAAFTGASTLEGYSSSFESQSDEAFDLALQLNLAVPFRIARRLAPVLKDSRNASVLNVSSIYGLVGPDLRLYEGTDMGNPAAYAASKGGLIQLTRYLSTVLAPEVRVNCLALGGIRRDQPPAFVERYVSRTPLGRMASEEDAVGTAVWLTSAEASYVTGQVVAVDGGWTAW